MTILFQSRNRVSSLFKSKSSLHFLSALRLLRFQSRNRVSSLFKTETGFAILGGYYTSFNLVIEYLLFSSIIDYSDDTIHRLFQSRNRVSSLFKLIPARIISVIQYNLFQSRNRVSSLFKYKCCRNTKRCGCTTFQSRNRVSSLFKTWHAVGLWMLGSTVSIS